MSGSWCILSKYLFSKCTFSKYLLPCGRKIYNCAFCYMKSLRWSVSEGKSHILSHDFDRLSPSTWIQGSASWRKYISKPHRAGDRERKRKIQGPNIPSQILFRGFSHMTGPVLTRPHLLRHQLPWPVTSLQLYHFGNQPFTHHAFGDISDSNCSSRCQLQILLLQCPSTFNQKPLCLVVYCFCVYFKGMAAVPLLTPHSLIVWPANGSRFS